ncbi:MAG TPA: hypothetical protein PLI31_00820 [Methanoregulaceae archaeon]|nr:hypothetical protein [Methanoregulaceae archaeon]
MARRTLLYVLSGLLVIALLVLISGCTAPGGGTGPGRSVPTTGVGRTPGPYQTLAGGAPPSTPVFSCKGEGTDETPSFTHASGPASLSYSYSGKGPFMVWLLDEDGYELDLLVDETGPVSDRVEVWFDEWGYYSFGVDADGEWTVSIT